MRSLSVSDIKQLLQTFPAGLAELGRMVREGVSPAMKRVERRLTRCIEAINSHDQYVDRESSHTDCDPAPFLWITGEKGVGKQELIRRIHEGCSERGYILEQDCESVDQQQIEAELFGHQAEGSQKETREGKLWDAGAGILAIYDPENMSKGCQSRLLERKTRPLRRSRDGQDEDPDPLPILVAARERPEELVQRGAVLPGLVTTPLTIHIPPLRERPEDVTLFIEYFLRAKVLELTGWEFSLERNFQDEALFLLVNFYWPDNMLALQEVVALLVGAVLFKDHDHRITVSEAIEALKRRYQNPDILKLLAPLFRRQSKKRSRNKDDVWLDELKLLRRLMDMKYDLEELAELLGISPSALWKRFSKAGLGGFTRGRRPS
ncbi:MAG: sigma 54-interacting transcriptional regulator [Desulfomonilaceae bacterium]